MMAAARTKARGTILKIYAALKRASLAQASDRAEHLERLSSIEKTAERNGLRCLRITTRTSQAR